MSTVISVRGVSKVYGNGVKALDNVSFEVRKGETVGLLGPNGAGKTTLMRIISGQLEPTSGEVYVLGVPYKELLEREERLRISYVPQENIFWDNLTVEENLFMMGAMYKIDKKVLRGRIDGLLRDYELLNVRKRLAKNLSGGMKKRLSIMMGLINDPEILILDEPTTGLDPRIRISVISMLEKLRRLGKTILISSHIVEDIERLCERVIIMDQGRIIADDYAEELKKRVIGSEVLEILFRNLDEKIMERIKSWVDEESIARAGYKLVIRGDDLVQLSEKIREDSRIYENTLVMSIRKSTLEDVFLFLTGKLISG